MRYIRATTWLALLLLMPCAEANEADLPAGDFGIARPPAHSRKTPLSRPTASSIILPGVTESVQTITLAAPSDGVLYELNFAEGDLRRPQ